MSEVKNIIALAEKIERGDISRNDARVKQATQMIAKMARTEQGREEIAEVVKMALEDSYNTFDISPKIFETKHFNYGDNPLFKTHKKGVKAYWTAPNAYVPMSRNYETEITMQFEGLGVRPECLLSELKTGRLDSLAHLIRDGRDAIEMEIYHKVYEVLAQTYNETSNKNNYEAVSALDKATLDKAINYLRKKTGGAPTIIGDFDLCTKIEGFAGFDSCESLYNEIRDKGLLGRYRGCDILYLPEILDPVTQKSIVPMDKLFLVGNKIGYAATYGDSDVMQEASINDKSWSCRIDKELGYCVTKPEGLFVIEVTG